MTPQRTLAGTLVVAALAAASLSTSAFADPAGTEYVPAIPKPNHHHSSGGGSDVSTTSVPTDTSAQGTKHKAKPKPEKKHKARPVDTASLETVSGGSEASFLPVILLITGGVFLISAAMVMRRRTRETVAFDVPEDERLWPERTTTRPTPEGEIFAGRDQTT